NIHIDHTLPVAGGMGGGSSDAGAVLRILQDLHPGKVSAEHLAQIALQIGADVPFFLDPTTSLADGVGEELQSLETEREIPLLLMTFNFPVSAAWAYINRHSSFARSNISNQQLQAIWRDGSSAEIATLVYNDLAFALRQKFPILERGRNDLLNYGASAAEVSGSGPTLFAIFINNEARDICRQKLISQGYSAEKLIATSAG
ncbi:MAG: hypothetical protein HRT88_04520, partial [Lentisphaeraceae bacterium]|nr:hypothetical protein [Lentisphaeraceae bacterium]